MKRKIPVEWPCGVCEKECSNGTIFCQKCDCWFHAKCEGLSKTQFSELDGSTLDYICKGCCKGRDGTFDFSAALARLSAASGLSRVEAATRREKILMRDVPCDIPKRVATSASLANEFRHIDGSALEILQRVGGVRGRMPYSVPGDGNCLYHALSLAYSGTLDHIEELRVRAAIDIVTQREFHKELYKSSGLTLVCPDYRNAVQSAVRSGDYASCWHIQACANVLRIPIESVYPPVNGLQDKTHKLLSRVFKPQSMKARTPLMIMWSHGAGVGAVADNQTWLPNHFVPLIEHLTPVETTPVPSTQKVSYTSLLDDAHPIREESNRSPISTPCAADSFILDASRPGNTSISLDVDLDEDQSSSTSNRSVRAAEGRPTASPVYPLHATKPRRSSAADATLDSTAQDGETSGPPEGACPLPNANFLDVSAVIDKILTAPSDLPQSIPVGTKENVYILIDNTPNRQRRNTGKMRSDFSDDCGAWDTKGTSPKTVYFGEGRQRRKLFVKDGQYCVEKQVNKKRIYVPLDPQPRPEELLEIQRHYATLKTSSAYRRRVTWINSLPSHVGSTQPVAAVVEYVGTFPGHAPHGNSQKSGRDYIRTPATVMEEIGTAVEHGKPKAVYDEMLDRTVTEAPRDMKQVQNKRYNVKKKQETDTRTGNLADQIQYLQSTIHNSEFVQQILSNRGKVPMIVLFTEEQISDIRRFCCQGAPVPSTVLGVDKTFNLTELHLTTTIYKNLAVYRRGTNDHPLYFGPMMLHGNSDYETFYSFFSSLVPCLSGLEQPVFGTDEEYALRKGIRLAFPQSNILACERHLKNNVIAYLRDKVGTNTVTRNRVLHRIFGPEGLAESPNLDVFSQRAEDVHTFCTTVSPQFAVHFSEKVLPLMKTNFAAGRPGWTNNNSESGNHILKTVIDWKPRSVTALVDHLKGIVRAQTKELERAVYNRGNYELCEDYTKFQLTEIEWIRKTKEQRQRYLRKFMKFVPSAHRTVTSKDGDLTVLTAPLAGKKPNQQKRMRASRTTTTTKK